MRENQLTPMYWLCVLDLCLNFFDLFSVYITNQVVTECSGTTMGDPTRPIGGNIMAHAASYTPHALDLTRYGIEPNPGESTSIGYVLMCEGSELVDSVIMYDAAAAASGLARCCANLTNAVHAVPPVATPVVESILSSNPALAALDGTRPSHSLALRNLALSVATSTPNVIYARAWSFPRSQLASLIAAVKATAPDPLLVRGKHAIADLLISLQSVASDPIELNYIGLTSNTGSHRWYQEDSASTNPNNATRQATLSFALRYLAALPSVSRFDSILCTVPPNQLHAAEAIIAHATANNRAHSINRAPCGSNFSEAKPIFADDECTIVSLVCFGVQSKCGGKRYGVEFFQKCSNTSTGYRPACNECVSSTRRKQRAEEAAAEPERTFVAHTNLKTTPVTDSKTCTRCHRRMLLEFFHTSTMTRDGRSTACRDCLNANKRAKRAKKQ